MARSISEVREERHVLRLVTNLIGKCHLLCQPLLLIEERGRALALVARDLVLQMHARAICNA